MSSPDLPQSDRLDLIPFHARILLQTGDPLSALSSLSSFPPSLVQSATAIESRMRLGEHAAALTAAYDLLRAVRGQNVEEPAVLGLLVGWHLRAGEHDSAVEVARDVVKSLGGSADAVYMYARVLLAVGDVDSAERAIEVGRKRKGGQQEWAMMKGLVLMARGRFAEAAAKFAEVKGGGVNWVRGMNNEAVCLMHMGRLNEAIDRLENIIREERELGVEEGVVANLAVMYDLGFGRGAEGKNKREVLAEVVDRLGREGFDKGRVPRRRGE